MRLYSKHMGGTDKLDMSAPFIATVTIKKMVLRKKCPYLEFFLSAFFRIRT